MRPVSTKCGDDEKKSLLRNQGANTLNNGEHMYSVQHGVRSDGTPRRHLMSRTDALEDNAVVIDPASDDSFLAYTAQAQRVSGSLASKPRCV